MKFASDMCPGDLIVDAPMTWSSNRGLVIANIMHDEELVKITVLSFTCELESRFVIRTRRFKIA